MNHLKSHIQSIFKKYGIAPRKYLGQNFLINANTIGKIVASAEIIPSDVVVEIGPGIGNLTRELLKTDAYVIAIEKDADLAKILEKEFVGIKNLDIKIGSILDFDESNLDSYVLVGNIPYYITGAILRKFLESKNPPEKIVLMVQKEVGERMAARAPKATFLSMVTALYADIEIVDKIPRNSFWPEPKIDSVVVRLYLKKPPDQAKELTKLLRKSFAQPRKTLYNNLLNSGVVDKSKLKGAFSRLGIKLNTRAHELDLNKWKALLKEIKA